MRYAAEAVAPLVGRQARAFAPSRGRAPGGARRPERRGRRRASGSGHGPRRSRSCSASSRPASSPGSSGRRPRRTARAGGRPGRSSPRRSFARGCDRDIVRAAGGLVWRRDRRRRRRDRPRPSPAYDDWAFPKGKLHAGESEREAALREVEEETGLLCRLERELGISSYRDARGSPEDRSLLGDGASRRCARTCERGRRRALGPPPRRARGAHVPTGPRPSRAIRSARTRPLPVPWMTTLTNAGRRQAATRVYLRRPRSLSVVRSGSPR